MLYIIGHKWIIFWNVCSHMTKLRSPLLQEKRVQLELFKSWSCFAILADGRSEIVAEYRQIVRITGRTVLFKRRLLSFWVCSSVIHIVAEQIHSATKFDKRHCANIRGSCYRTATVCYLQRSEERSVGKECRSRW